MTDPLLYMQGLTDSQRMLFLSEFNARRKDGTTGLLLALFLGGFGAHRFYLGQTGLGIIYLLFCFVSWMVALVEVFLMKGRVERYNADVAMEVAAKVKVLSGASA